MKKELILFSIDHCDGASEKVLKQIKKIKITVPCVVFVEHTKNLVLKPECETNPAKRNFWRKIISFVVHKGCDVVPLRIQQRKKFFNNPDALSNALINMWGELNDENIIVQRLFEKKQKIALIGGTHAGNVAKSLQKIGFKVKIIRTRELTVIRIQELSAKKAISELRNGNPKAKYIAPSWPYKITRTALKRMNLRFEQVEKNASLWNRYNRLCTKIKKMKQFKLRRSDYRVVTEKQKKELLEKDKIIRLEFEKRNKKDHSVIFNKGLKKIYTNAENQEC